MFERIEVWDRTPDCIWVYIVFRNAQTGLFHVQQANALYADDLTLVNWALAQMNLSEPELFREQCPSERSQGFSTAAIAVAHHKAAFADMMETIQ